MSAEPAISFVDFLDAAIDQPEPGDLDISRLLSHRPFRAITLKAFSDKIESTVSGPLFYMGVGAGGGKELGRRMAKHDRRGFVSIRKKDALKRREAKIISRRLVHRRQFLTEPSFYAKDLKRALREIKPDMEKTGQVTIVVFDDTTVRGYIARGVAHLLQGDDFKKEIGKYNIRLVFAFVAETLEGRKYIMKHCTNPVPEIISFIRYRRAKGGRLVADRTFGMPATAPA